MKRKLTRPAKNSVMLTTSLLALSVVPGCTWLNNIASDWPPQTEQQKQENKQQSRAQSLDSPGAMADRQREYRYTQMPEAPEPQQQGRMRGDMADPRGLNVDQQSGRTPQRARGRSGAQAQDRQPQDRQLGQRLSRIEKQLSMLRRDFADIKPVMRKVQAAERQIHQLSRELSQIDGANGAVPSRKAGAEVRQSGNAGQRNADRPPMTWQQARRQAEQKARQRADSPQQSGRQQAKPQQKPQQKPGARSDRTRQKAQQHNAGSAYVKNVRTGTFKGNTRLVLDLSRPAADFSYDLDNRENLLVVEIDGAGWRAQEAQELANSDLISSISAGTTRRGGSRMVVELSEQAKVVRAQKLPPTGNNGHRIFMDLAAQ